VKPLRVDIHPVVVHLYVVAKLLLKMPQPTLAHKRWLPNKGTKQALDRPSPRMRGSLDQAFCISVEGSGPRWTEPVKGGACLCQRGLSCCHDDHGDNACAVEEFLYYRSRVGDQYLRAFLLGVCGYLWLRPIVPRLKRCGFP
jgi:hypothetical protein